MRAALWAARAMAAAGAAALALAPHLAAAHATVISSQPQPNASYATAPGAVVLVFSEPLNTALSRASVSTPAGRRAQATVVQDRQMQVPVPDTAPGVYRVEWTTVSALDGHVLRGSFEFGVRVKLGGAGLEGGPALAATDWLLGALRWIEYLGRMVAIGALLINRLAQRPPALPWAMRSAVLPIAVALGAGTTVVIVEAANSVQALILTAATAYLTAGTAGAARLARLALEAMALAAALRRPGLAPVPVAAAAVALAASSHAAALPAWPGPIALDAAHLLAAGAWAGGILIMATLRPPEGWLSQTGRALLDRFSPLALAAFLVTLLTGALQAALEVGLPERLLSTAYGNTLLVKAFLVAAALPLSVLAWRRVRARPRAEAGLVVLVVGASSLLASYPVTPARLGDEGTTQQQAGSPLGLPSDGSLSLASHAGETLVAVAVRPARPGPNSIYLDLLPISGPAAGARLRPSLSIDGRLVASAAAGPTVGWRAPTCAAENTWRSGCRMRRRWHASISRRCRPATPVRWSPAWSSACPPCTATGSTRCWGRRRSRSALRTGSGPRTGCATTSATAARR